VDRYISRHYDLTTSASRSGNGDQHHPGPCCSGRTFYLLLLLAEIVIAVAAATTASRNTVDLCHLSMIHNVTTKCFYNNFVYIFAND